MSRISKENYYLDIAETVLERATCLRRVYGAIIVKNDEIIATGYNGAPRGRANCTDMGYCSRQVLKIPGGTLYLVGKDAQTGRLLEDATSCAMCRRLVINSGLEKVIIRRTPEEFEEVPVAEWVAEDDLLVPRDPAALLDEQ